MKNIDTAALKTLKSYRGKLTRQQIRTLKGQILAGDAEGAIKGLKKLLKAIENC
jgi:hypothetical protein